MKKSLIIKLAVAIVIVLLSYCVFWLFKIGQSERKITSIVQKSKIVSFDKISSSGFPVSQKITIENLKINIPVNAIEKRNFIVKKIEISSSIFSNNFKAQITDAIEVKASDNNNAYELQFNSAPEISFNIVGNAVNDLTYSDSGFKILDTKNNSVIHTASSMNISLPAPFVFEQEDSQNPVSISLNIKQLTGYSFLNFYKNIFENKIIEGIKTGEIKINQVVQANPLSLDPAFLSNLATTNPALFQQIQQLTIAQINPNNTVDINNQIQQLVIQANANAQNIAQAPVQNPAGQAPAINANAVNADVATQNQQKPNAQAVQVPVKANADQPRGANINQNIADSQKPTPPAPTQVAEQVSNVANQAVSPTDNSVVATQPANTVVGGSADNVNQPVPSNAVAVANLDSANNSQPASNNAIDIALEIEISSTPVEKSKTNAEVPVDPSLIEENNEQYAENILIKSMNFSHEKYKISVNGKLVSLLDDINLSGGITVKIENYFDFVNLLKTELQNYTQQNVIKENSDPLIFEKYQTFLRYLNNSLPNISNEIASKNPATKDNNAQLDIRREKNLDFIVNETPIYEILGKI